MYNENIIEYLKKMNIYYKKEKINFSNYEDLIMNTIFSIIKNKSKKSLFVSLDKDLSYIIATIFIALYNYIINVLDKDNNILNQLNVNDKVVKGNVVYTYLGQNQIRDKKYILLNDTKGCRSYIPMENIYQITKYNGNASRINKSRDINAITKNYIADLLEVPKEEFVGIISSCSIIIVENKEELFKIMDCIEISYNDKKYNISEIFPFAYCSSLDRFEFMKGNRIKQNPLIKFVSNSSVAMDIISDNTNINNVLFFGTKTYKDVIDTYARQMELYDYINNIIFFDTIDSAFDFTLFDEEFSIYALTQNIILNNVNLYSNYECKLQSNNLKLLNNFVNKQINIYEIDEDDKISDYISEVYADIKKLRKYQYNMDINHFVMISCSLCKKIRQSILPLKESKKNLYKITNYLKLLKDRSKEINQTRVEYPFINSIIEKLDNIINVIFTINCKNNFIKSKYKNHKNLSMIIKNKDELNELVNYYRKYPSIHLNIYDFKEYVSNMINSDYLIMPYCCNDKRDINIILMNCYKNLDIFIYSYEKKIMEYIIKRANDISQFLNNNNKLSDKLEDYIDLYCIHKNYDLNKKFNSDIQYETEEDIDDDEDIDNLLGDQLSFFSEEIVNYNDDNIIQSSFGMLRKENQLSFFNDKLVDYNAYGDISNNSILIRKIILFDNGYCALLTSHYKANVLSDDGKDIIQKPTDRLQVGDKMIFIVDKTSEDGDIVKKVIKNLLSYSEFNNDYGECFKLNKLWKNKLKEYMLLNNMSEADISNNFLVHGRKINRITISNWIDGNIIGPRDENDIRIVASIINDEKINSNIEEIIKACSTERKLQIRIRKIVAQIIMSSLLIDDEKDSSLYSMIKNIIGDFRKYIYIKPIKKISDFNDSVNTLYVNKLIKNGGINIE
ncbi:MAG: DrmE family protein [Clostridiales bacterium]|nr:DrmE family protein [Clostridiales bacterium]